jgi:pyrroline-5-carboxylate reductase
MVQTIGIIGFGYMGEALIKGVKASHSSVRVAVSDKRSDRVSVATEEYGATDYTGLEQALCAESDILIIAVKPQDKESLVQSLGTAARGARIISVLAGTKMEFFQERIPEIQIARFMPSLAAQVGKAAVGVAFSENVDEQFRNTSVEIAEAIGSAQVVPERLMSAVTGLSGSGLAFVFAFVHALALGATKSGLSYDQAQSVALDVLDGAQTVLRETGEHPISMLSKVASPGGTTIEGIQALEDGGLTSVVMDAVTKAAARASELEG